MRRISRPGEAAALVRAPGALENEVVVPPREAFLGDADVVAVDDAVGRVSAESIAGYPPGIPALLPGRADHDRARRLPARAQGVRRAPARRERPRVPNHLRAGAVEPSCCSQAYRTARRRPAVGRSAALPRRGDGGLLLALHGARRRPRGDRHVRRQPLARGRALGVRRARRASRRVLPLGGAAGRARRPAPATASAPAPRSRPGRTTCGSTSGPTAALDAELAAPVAWPRRAFGGLGGAHAIPGLSQYWHPHLFAAGVRGRVVAGHGGVRARRRRRVRGEELGRRLPRSLVVGAGARLRRSRSRSPSPAAPSALGPARLDATAAVVRLDGRVLRCRPPAAVELGDGAAGACAPAPARTASRSRARPIRPPPARSPCPCRPSGARSTARSTISRARCASASTRRGATVYAGESAARRRLERGWCVSRGTAILVAVTNSTDRADRPRARRGRRRRRRHRGGDGRPAARAPSPRSRRRRRA